MKLGKCFKCGGDITREDVYVSPCTDDDCCGLNHEITHECGYSYETDDFSDLVETLQRLGDKSEKEIEKSLIYENNTYKW